MLVYRLNALLASGVYSTLVSLSGSRLAPLRLLAQEWLLISVASVLLVCTGILFGYAFNEYIALRGKLGDAAAVLTSVAFFTLAEALLAAAMLAPLVFRGRASLAAAALIAYAFILNHIPLVAELGGGLPAALLTTIRPADAIIHVLTVYMAGRYSVSELDLEAASQSTQLLQASAALAAPLTALLAVVNAVVMKKSELP